ncbi:MAG TPA: SGNH/GDSL hydrolase family protein [Burkholderiales bacterium]|nr:SGNH/GDSL hydrolase family protein [Burkholderiales bacterium]
MTHRGGIAMKVLFVIGAVLLAVAGGRALASEQCISQPGQLELGAALPKARAAINDRKELEVVALGSSSTQGYGASTPFHSYPAALLRTLQRDLPGVKVTVINKGIGGQDVTQMLDRLERDVFAVEPDIVVWQVGTNAALRAQSVAEFRRLLAGGIERMHAKGIEVVLMTPQFAPAFNALENEQDYLAAMSEVAREEGVGVFPRYEIMKYWFETEQMPYARFIARDGLHMNDFGYMCIGRLLAEALEGAIRR